MDKIDRQQLNQLVFIEMTSEEKIIDHLLELYQEQVAKYAPLIESESEGCNLDKVSHMAHSLKSSAANLGMIAVEQICLHIETESKKNHQINYRELVEKIRLESEQALVQIRAFLTDQK